MNAKRINVGLHLEDQTWEVGELVLDDRDIRFKYFPDFLDFGFDLSPIKLPFTDKVHTGNPSLFDGLLGVFYDSLPDGWGRLLLDRALSARGEDPFNINPLDRLAYVGDSGLGALIYYPSKHDPQHERQRIELDVLECEMSLILKGTSSELIEELYHLGGTSGGARPKVHVGYNENNDHLIHGKHMIPDGYEHWIIKFPSLSDRLDIAHIEYAYYLMALEAGIEMAPSKLFHSTSGAQFFGTKRFDRVGNKRLHLHSACGIMHDDYRHSQLDYGHLMGCAFQLEHHVKAYEKVLRLAAFNVYSHNQDDHSKNFAFLMDSKGVWKFAPAYDLTFSYSSFGMHTTTIAGEGREPGDKHLLELAEHFGIKKANEILDQVKIAISRWHEFAKIANVSEESNKIISKALKLI